MPFPIFANRIFAMKLKIWDNNEKFAKIVRFSLSNFCKSFAYFRENILKLNQEIFGNLQQRILGVEKQTRTSKGQSTRRKG
jgi:hypothetical protein